MVYTAGELLDLGPVPVPPGPYGAGYGQVMLKLWEETAAGTYQVNVDYLSFLGPDGVRTAETVGMQWQTNDVFVIDEIEGQAYGESGGVRYPYLIPGGEPLLLIPGATNRITQVAAPSTGTGAVNHTYTMRLYYRPRRASL